jgi:hypothetical protein
MSQISQHEVTSGVYSCSAEYNAALQLARSYLVGVTDDYLFYCRSSSVDASSHVRTSEFILLTGSVSRDQLNNDYIVTDGFCRHMITTFDTSSSDAVPAVTATYYAAPDSVILADIDGQIIFSSCGSDPRLIDGGVYYGFSALVLAAIALALCGFAAIWRRLY